MEFEYTDRVCFSKTDLRKIYKDVKNGIPFKKAFKSIILPYDNEEYYSALHVYNQVEAEINRRLLQSNK